MSDTNNKENINKNRFTFGEHLEELRTRIILCVVAVIFCFAICWIFKTTILSLAKRPHLIAMERFGLISDLQVISYQEGFYAYMKLCFISALFFAYPIIVYQIWRFVGPGLYEKERKYFLLFILTSFLAFIIGILFGYFFLIPIGLQFLIGMLGSGIAPIITMGPYVSFVFLLTVMMGFVFQLPLIILLLTKIGLFSADKFILWRKYAILISFIVAAVITPPDPFTQILTAIPMIALYEAGILIAKPTKRGMIYFGSILAGGALSASLFFIIFTCFSELGTISEVKGKVVLESSNINYPHATAINTKSQERIKIRRGMCLKTGISSKAVFNMNNGIFLIIGNETNVKIIDKRTINIINGQIFLKAPEMKANFTVSTPNGNTMTRFGEVNIEALPFETIVTVAKGKALLSNGNIEKSVLEGRQGRMTIGGDPVDVDDIIEWAK